MTRGPCDVHGQPLAVGDHVLIHATVTALRSDDGCNLQVGLRQVRHNAVTYLSLHTQQVEIEKAP